MHCVHTITTEVADLEADLPTRMVEIVYDEPATEEKIKTLLAEIDYPVAA
jgi:copper chaperone CopZ